MIERQHGPSVRRLSLAALASWLLLFLWGGLTQLLPWGLSTVRTFATTSGDPYVFGADRLQTAAPNTFTTSAFESAFGQGISTLATDASFSWIVSVPSSAYDPTRYFALELLSQLMVAIVLVAVLATLAPLGPRRAIRVVLLLCVAAMVATYGVMANWWGLPAEYALGMAANLVFGWAVAATSICVVLFRGRSNA